jgi:hypothetical protein
MVELDVVAVVRKVYRKNAAARLGVLCPEQDRPGHTVLAYVELPFAEEVRDLSFPSLPGPGEEQLSAVDDLIDVMMLTQGEGEDRVEAMRPEETLNPSYQYLYQVLTDRALRPGCLVPPPAAHVTAPLSLPDEILAALPPARHRMAEVFPTEDLARRKAKRTAEAVLGREDAPGPEPKRRAAEGELELGTAGVSEVGSVRPVEDFRTLLGRGQALEGVSQQLEDVVLRLLVTAFGGDMDTKVLSCLAAYREEAEARTRPGLYNAFIRRVRESVGGRGRLWEGVAAAALGLLAEDGLPAAERAAFLLQAGGQAGAEEEEEEDLLDQL